MLPFEAPDISTQTRSSASAYLSDDQAGDDVLKDRNEDDLLEVLRTADALIQPSEGAMVLSYWALACGEVL